LLLSGLGGIALGASAAVTAALEAVGGERFVVNISSHTYLAPSDCARWLANDPAAHTCFQAALSDWAWEAWAYRAVVGVFGIIALVAYGYLQRRWRAQGVPTALPRPMVDAVAAAGFGAAGVWLAGLGIDDVIVNSGHGAGQGLGTAPAVLVIAGVFAVRVVQDLRRPDARVV
jgi:hypothetical protein